MLDLTSGALTFKRPLTTLGPELTRSEFLQSDVARNAATLIQNEPWHSWSLAGTFLAEYPFAVALYFRGDALAMIDMAHVNAKFGLSWDDWAEEKELARKASHDEWVSRNVGAQRSFPWGEVSSLYDAKGGGSHLSICYAAWRKP